MLDAQALRPARGERHAEVRDIGARFGHPVDDSAGLLHFRRPMAAARDLAIDELADQVGGTAAVARSAFVTRRRAAGPQVLVFGLHAGEPLGAGVGARLAFAGSLVAGVIPVGVELARGCLSAGHGPGLIPQARAASRRGRHAMARTDVEPPVFRVARAELPRLTTGDAVVRLRSSAGAGKKALEPPGTPRRMIARLARAGRVDAALDERIADKARVTPQRRAVVASPSRQHADPGLDERAAVGARAAAIAEAWLARRGKTDASTLGHRRKAGEPGGARRGERAGLAGKTRRVAGAVDAREIACATREAR